jgi:hypothetical protein
MTASYKVLQVGLYANVWPWYRMFADAMAHMEDSAVEEHIQASVELQVVPAAVHQRYWSKHKNKAETRPLTYKLYSFMSTKSTLSANYGHSLNQECVACSIVCHQRQERER